MGAVQVNCCTQGMVDLAETDGACRPLLVVAEGDFVRCASASAASSARAVVATPLLGESSSSRELPGCSCRADDPNRIVEGVLPPTSSRADVVRNLTVEEREETVAKASKLTGPHQQQRTLGREPSGSTSGGLKDAEKSVETKQSAADAKKLAEANRSIERIAKRMANQNRSDAASASSEEVADGKSFAASEAAKAELEAAAQAAPAGLSIEEEEEWQTWARAQVAREQDELSEQQSVSRMLSEARAYDAETVALAKKNSQVMRAVTKRYKLDAASQKNRAEKMERYRLIAAAVNLPFPVPGLQPKKKPGKFYRL